MKKIKSRKSFSRTRLLPPLKAKDVPATAGMLYATRDELKADIRRLEFNFDKLENKFDAKFEILNGRIHQLALLVEEQNARNRVVQDGLDHIFQRQGRIEGEFVKRFG
ncbi:MAG: hypothetical protein AB7N80_09955 [Bdellovibrionales bacterium]